MNLQLLPKERAAFAAASAAIDRIFNYCGVMLERGAPLDDIDTIADVHATSACMSIELQDIVAMIDGTPNDPHLIEAKKRVLHTASYIIEQTEPNSTIAARLRVMAGCELTEEPNV